MGAGYMARACGPDGQFVYRVHLDPEVTPGPSYNVLRHAGAIYSLGMCYERDPNDEVRLAIIRAGEFLRRECLGEVTGHDDMLAVWSPPDLVGLDNPVQSKLGGTGLGLIALLALERVKPGATTPEDLRRLGRFLVYLQKDDGSFYSKYIPDEGGRWDEWTSLYYPGEAALALVMLYEHDASPEWLQAAARALGYLAESRKDAADVPADHWAMLATARLLPLYDEVEMPVSREALLRHARQVCRRLLEGYQSQPDDPRLAGSFTGDGRTCPAATTLEGLLGVLSFLPPDEWELRAEIEDAVSRGIGFLVRSQVVDGEFVGGMPRAVSPLYRDPYWPEAVANSIDEFNRRAGEIRIDYVQHATSAMIGYEKFVGDRSRAPRPAGAAGR